MVGRSIGATMLLAATSGSIAEAGQQVAGPTWQMLSMLLAAVVFGAGFWWYAKNEFVPRREYNEQRTARDQRCARCEGDIGRKLPREYFEQYERETRRELEHRKGSTDTLGKAIVRLDRRSQRLEVYMAAIAAKHGVEVDARTLPPLIVAADQEDEG